MARGLAAFDRLQLGQTDRLIGIDEAGRGCLAGPVMAAAVRLSAEFYATSWCRRHGPMVDDSKRLSPSQRAAVVDRFASARERGWLQVGIGSASIDEIERFNIYHANTLAMRRALQQVLANGVDPLWETTSEPYAESQESPASVVILIDGRPIRHFPLPHRAIVKGDQKSLAIALAGIHAKEARDAHLRELHKELPEYGFLDHKGYGTEQHLAALRQHGPSPHHRPSFLRKFFASCGDHSIETPATAGSSRGEPDPTQDSLFPEE